MVCRLIRQVLVTGATGFVGRPLCRALARSGVRVRALYRGPHQEMNTPGIELQRCGDIAAVQDWGPILEQIDAVFHLAGRAHVLDGHAHQDEDFYARDNFTATLSLARGAAACGVRRFVFLSSVKVYGDGPFSQPLAAYRIPEPSDHYGWSKWRAEQELRTLGTQSSMDIAIVRPPLVYGPGVRANFLRLLQWIERGLPLPFSTIHNQRSLMGIDNLIEFLIGLGLQTAPGAGTWHVADAETCSTAELIRMLAVHMRRPARLFPCPQALLRTGLTLVGRRQEYLRLCGSLVVDTQATRTRLHWLPSLSLNEGLARTVAWFHGTLGEARQ